MRIMVWSADFPIGVIGHFCSLISRSLRIDLISPGVFFVIEFGICLRALAFDNILIIFKRFSHMQLRVNIFADFTKNHLHFILCAL